MEIGKEKSKTALLENKKAMLIFMLICTLLLAGSHFFVLGSTVIGIWSRGFWEITPDAENIYADIAFNIVYVQWALFVIGTILIVFLYSFRAKKPIYIVLISVFCLSFALTITNIIAFLELTKGQPIRARFLQIALLAFIFAVCSLVIITLVRRFDRYLKERKQIKTGLINNVIPVC